MHIVQGACSNTSCSRWAIADDSFKPRASTGSFIDVKLLCQILILPVKADASPVNFKAPMFWRLAWWKAQLSRCIDRVCLGLGSEIAAYYLGYRNLQISSFQLCETLQLCIARCSLCSSPCPACSGRLLGKGQNVFYGLWIASFMDDPQSCKVLQEACSLLAS